MRHKGIEPRECEIIMKGIDALVDRVISARRLDDLKEFARRIRAFHRVYNTEPTAPERAVLALCMLRCEEYATFETVSEVYLPNTTTKHRRINDLILDRIHQDYRKQVIASGKDPISLRTVEGLHLPTAQGEELKALKAAGWKPSPGEPKPTLVNSVDAHVDYACTSGHYLLPGTAAGADYFGLSQSTYERTKPQGVQFGNVKYLNVTSESYRLHKK